MLDLNALEAEGKLVPWRTRAKSATGNKFLYAGRGSMGDHMFVSMQRDATEESRNTRLDFAESINFSNEGKYLDSDEIPNADLIGVSREWEPRVGDLVMASGMGICYGSMENVDRDRPIADCIGGSFGVVQVYNLCCEHRPSTITSIGEDEYGHKFYRLQNPDLDGRYIVHRSQIRRVNA